MDTRGSKRVWSGERRLGRHGSSSVCVPSCRAFVADRLRYVPSCRAGARFGLSLRGVEKHKYLAPRECAVRVQRVRAVHRHELVSGIAQLSLARKRSKISGSRTSISRQVRLCMEELTAWTLAGCATSCQEATPVLVPLIRSSRGFGGSEACRL